jgi:hypothetical protein
MNKNSRMNQEIKGEFVSLNVEVCITSMVEYILAQDDEKAPFSLSDMVNLDEEDEAREVMEWWIVSEFLMKKLKEHGEIIIPHEKLWGRCQSGQQVKMEGVIDEICSDMGILEGQENSWEYKFK